MPSGELLDRATQSGEGGGEGKKASLGDYALKNKLKCHPHIKKLWLAVTINFLTETRPTVSKFFNLPIATICKGAGSNGFAIKTKTGKEIAKLAKELICKPWSQDYEVFMNMLITQAHRWEWLVGENTGILRDLNPRICTAGAVSALPTSLSSQQLGSTGNSCGPCVEAGKGTRDWETEGPCALLHHSRRSKDGNCLSST